MSEPRTVDEAQTLGEMLAICEADTWHTHDMPERGCIVCHLRLLLYGTDTEPGLVERVSTDFERTYNVITSLQAEIGGEGATSDEGSEG